jgi:hypothetical protein
MKKFRNVLAILIMACIISNGFSAHVRADGKEIDSFIGTFGSNTGELLPPEISDGHYSTNYIIYSDKDKGLVIYCRDGKLQRYIDGDILSGFF